MYDLTATERANKTALLIVHQRYQSQLAPFVKSAARLTYVQSDIAGIIADVSAETNADEAWVTEHFADYLSAVLEKDKNIKTEELPKVNPEDPYSLNGSDPIEGIKDADVLDRGEVPGAGLAEATTPDATVDLDGDDSADEGAPTEVDNKTACFRCGEELGKIASKSPVCAKCTHELLKNSFLPGEDAATGIGAGAEEPGLAPEDPVNPNVPYVCTICGREENRDELLDHINREHADVLQRKQQDSTENMGQDDLGVNPLVSKWVLADVPRAEDSAEVEPLPENPGDRFDDYVQKLAETAAARKFSQLSDEEIHTLSSQLGVSPDEVKNNIKVVAVFGENVGVNGQLGGDPSPPEGYQEVPAQGLSGQQPTHDAVVPTDLIIQTVANDLNMSTDLAYQQVRDKYGADLPDKYHASISGQVHYYLPAEMAANAQPKPQDPQVGPTPGTVPTQQAPQTTPIQGQPNRPTM